MFELGYDQCGKVRLIKIRIDGKDIIDGKNNQCKSPKYMKAWLMKSKKQARLDLSEQGRE